jgi:hypothetical protein
VLSFKDFLDDFPMIFIGFPDEQRPVVVVTGEVLGNTTLENEDVTLFV